MGLMANEFGVDESNAKRLKSWLSAGQWSSEEATLLFLEIDPDRTHGDCFSTFSGPGSIRYEYYDDDDPSSLMSYGVGDDGEPEYLSSEQRTLMNETRRTCKEIARKINLFESAKPHEWIDLAVEKDIVIPWLAWAIKNNLYVGTEVPAKQSSTGPKLEGSAAIWKSKAFKRASEIIEEHRARDLYPSQISIADQISKEFRTAGVVGLGGKPLRGAYIKRHALKGISSAQCKQISTSTSRGK